MEELWLDFDNTVFDSTKAFLHTYNIMFEDTKKESTLCWDFNDCGVKKEYIKDVFNSSLFFTYLKPYENAIEIIKELAKTTRVNFITIGNYQNIRAKIWLLKEVLKITDEVGMIPIIIPDNKPIAMNKEIVQGGILLDDNPKNLITSKAKHKVLFSWQDKPYDWQENYIPEHKMTAWDNDGYNLLLKLIKGEM